MTRAHAHAATHSSFIFVYIFLNTRAYDIVLKTISASETPSPVLRPNSACQQVDPDLIAIMGMECFAFPVGSKCGWAVNSTISSSESEFLERGLGNRNV